MKRKSILSLLVLLAVLLCIPVQAAGNSSLEISYLDGNIPLPEVTFHIFRVSDLNGILAEHFADSGVFLWPSLTNAEWVEAAETLAAYAEAQGLEPDGTAVTDSRGRCRFENLEDGLYLVTGSKVNANGKMYTMQVFLAHVEGASSAEPKFISGYIPTLDSFAYAGDYEPDMDSRTKWVLEDPDATVTDEVYLGGLEPGADYELRSVILNDTYDFGFPVPALFNGRSMRENYGSELGDIAEDLVMDVFDAWGIPYPDEPSAESAREAVMSGGKPMLTAEEVPDSVPKWHPSGMWFTLPAAIDEEKIGSLLTDPRYAQILGLIAFERTPFRADSGSMTVSTVFEHLNTVNKSGQDLRVFQILAKDGYIVATEVVEQYERQTVYVRGPEIDTNATVEGGHAAYAGRSVTVKDTVTYSGLTPGKEYRLEGWIMDADTGKEIPSGRASMTFVPESESGTVIQEFTVDSSDLAGRSIVVFETLYREEYEMAAHQDLEDADQTIEFLEPGQDPKYGGFSLTKEVTGSGDRNREWHFTVTLDPRLNGTFGGYRFENGVAHVTLKSGETVHFTGIRSGTKYTVTEDEAGQNGYQTTVENGSGTVSAGGNVTVTFRNILDPEKETGDLSVTKETSGIGDRSKSWHFRVTLEPKLNGTYGDLTFTDGVCEFTLKHGEAATAFGLPEGTRYSVSEREADQDGYSTEASGSSGAVSGSSSARFVNTLDPEAGDLSVTKQVTGDGDRNRDWHFTVTLDPKLSGTYGDLTFTDGVCEFTLKHGETVTASGLPEGTRYTVSEKEANQDGYSTDVSGSSGSVHAGRVSEAVFVNSPVKDKTPVQPGNPSSPSQTPSGPSATVPQTGDTSNMALWIALLVLSAAGILILTLPAIRKKFRRNGNTK